MRAVLKPADRDYPVGLRSGVDFRAPGTRDPATKTPEPMPSEAARVAYWARKAMREGKMEMQLVQVVPAPTHVNHGSVGPLIITPRGEC